MVIVKRFRQTFCLVLIVFMAASSVLAGAASPAFLAAPAAPMAESCHQALMPRNNTDSKLPAAPVSPNRYMCCVAGHEAAVVRGFHVQTPLAELAGEVTESQPAAASGPPPSEYRLGSPPTRDPHPMRI
jgi:hypothetical protein